MNKKYNNLIYFVYIIAVVTITCLFSLKILERPEATGFAVLPEESEQPEYTYHCSETSNSSVFHTKMVPNCETIFDGLLVKLPITHIKTNSYGFRDYEYSIEKPADTFRIIALGDSITWAHGVEIDDSYPKVLERILNNNTKSDLKYEVLNLGASGYNTLQEVEFFKEIGIQFNPDLILIQYTSDDIYDRMKIQEIYGSLLENYLKDKNITNGSGLPHSVNGQLYIEATEIYKKELEKKNFDEVWKIVKSPLSELNNISNRLGADVLIIIVQPVEEKHLSELEKIADEYGWGMVRADRLFDKYGWLNLTLHPKDNHPNAFAHRLIAEEVYKKLIADDLI